MAKPAKKTNSSLYPPSTPTNLVVRNGILALVEVMPKTALLAGATGLVGRELLKLLLNDSSYQQVVVFSRKSPDTIHPKLKLVEGSLDELAKYSGKYTADHAFCCLGTTMAQAGSQEAFKKVDLEYVVAFAKLARSCGVERFALVSALGASPGSSVFYNRVKGEAEEAIKALHFKHTIILRPSLLLGQRKQSRPAEAAGQWLARKLDFLFVGPLKKYRAIKAEDVAAATLYLSHTGHNAWRLAENEEIPALADLYQ
jgi:uncharacterized protein YbjT (DUF2867 family)